MTKVAALVRSAAIALRHRVRRQWAVFGWMGLPMILVFLLSAAWTSMLAAIQLVPTEVANYLMGTGDLDDGEFWLLARGDDSIAVPAATLLTAFALGYVWLALYMTFVDELQTVKTVWSCSLRRIRRIAVQPTALSATSTHRDSKLVRPTPLSVMVADPPATVVESPPRWRKPLKLLLNQRFTSILRNYDNPAAALSKLILQSTTLIKYLRDGFPTILIINYVTLLTINWFIACDRSVHQRRDPRLVLRRVYFSFDLFFAVLAPMLVLVYAYNHFSFDRDVFETRELTLPPGSFDRTARLFADPTHVSLFRIAFQTMQLTSATSLLIKTVLNVFTLRKWYDTITTLVELDRRPRMSSQNRRRSSASRSASAIPNTLRRDRWGSVLRMLFAVCFAGLGSGLFVYTTVSVASSKFVCGDFPNCHVPSYRWNVGAQSCSCVVFVDSEMHVASYAEWLNFVDTTANLASAAMTGDLRFVQIINRQVPVLPDELQRCRGLEQLVLIHTRTLAVPDWAAGFTNLQYLNIEGELTSKQLTYMPPDLFANMPRLQFLHLGCLLGLPEIPRFGNLPRLRYLVLALLRSASEIPSVDQLPNLRQFNIIDAARVTSLPSVKSLQNLETFVLAGRNPVCCNGFMTGTCDLTDPSCVDRTADGEPLVACTQERISGNDYARLTSTVGIICPPLPPGLTHKDSTSLYETIDTTCGGVEYRQCTQNNMTGICFPGGMNPIACQFGPDYIAMRQLQIERNVGTPCDPVVEAWLGCGRT